MGTTEEIWRRLAERGGSPLDERRLGQLGKYLDLLLAANERMNLTRIEDRAAAEILHVADALTLLPHLPAGAHRLADVGSGGGVPGMIVAMVRPDVAVTLIESTKKKAAFLSSAAGELGLGNVVVDPRRAEDVGRSPARESFDVAVARAVATLPWLVEWMLPLVKKEGCVLAMKGPKVRQELPETERTIRMLGGGAAEVFGVDLPRQDEHVIVRIGKIGRTDVRYPRNASVAKGKILGWSESGR